MSVRRGLTDAAKGLARRAGLEVRRIPQGPVYDAAPYERRGRLLARHGIDLVLDVGAHEGNYGRWLRAVGYTGRIVSFEPVGRSFEVLASRSRADPLWDCHRVALGDRDGECEINVSRATVGSSLLPMEDRLLESHPALEYTGRETVPVARLDSFASELNGRKAMLKLDVQGYEMQVLDGAGELLKGMGAIEVELSMVSLYRDSPLIHEMIDCLAQRGFRLVFLEPVHDEPHTGYTLQADGVFVPAAAAEGVPSSAGNTSRASRFRSTSAE